MKARFNFWRWMLLLGWLCIWNGSVCAQVSGYFEEPRRVPGIRQTGQWDVCMAVTGNDLTMLYFSDHKLYQATRNEPDQPFGDVRVLGGNINGTDDGLEPSLGLTLSPDGLILIFTRDPVGGAVFWDRPRLFEARRDSIAEPFGPAHELEGGVNSASAVTPDISPDGKMLLFSSRDRVGGVGSDDIWVATRDSLDDPFGEPVNANDFFPGSKINTTGDEVSPSLSSDGLVLLFGEHRPGKVRSGRSDLWVATRRDTHRSFRTVTRIKDFGEGSFAAHVSSIGLADSWPTLSRNWPADGSKLYFSRIINTVGLDIYSDFYESTWYQTPIPKAQWKKINFDSQNAPTRRNGAGMVFDKGRGHILMHGGHSEAGTFQDTWTWDGESWTLVSEDGPKVWLHEMAYDTQRGVTVLYGGRVGSEIQNLNDTWEWDGVTWNRIETNQDDPSLVLFTMEYDPELKMVIRHGGTISGDFVNVDPTVYGWDGAKWKTISQGTHFGGAQASFYDSKFRQLITFSGVNDRTGFRPGVDRETWGLKEGEWSLVASVGPSARNFHAMAYDSQRKVGVLFGGFTWPDGPTFSDTWEWNGIEWNQINTNPSPGARDFHAMAYDAKRRQIVLFGGDGTNDIWEYGLLSVTASPPTDDGSMVLRWYGGEPPYQVQSKTDLNSDQWENEGEPINELSLRLETTEPAKIFRVTGQHGQ